MQELMEEETIIRWQRVKEAATSACHEVLGPRNPNHKEWISTETLTKIEERKAKKAAVNKEPNTSCKS